MSSVSQDRTPLLQAHHLQVAAPLHNTFECISSQIYEPGGTSVCFGFANGSRNVSSPRRSKSSEIDFNFAIPKSVYDTLTLCNRPSESWGCLVQIGYSRCRMFQILFGELLFSDSMKRLHLPFRLDSQRWFALFVVRQHHV